MSQADAARAVNELKNAVLADPELKAIAERASSFEELEALWQSERFRAVHEKAVQGVKEEDVREYLQVLSDEDLEGVTGGVLIGMSQPAVQNLSPRGAYLAALGSALKGSHGAFIPCV